MAKTEKNSYSESLNELEIILSELDKNETIDMDTITKKVKRASELLSICRNRLVQIDNEIEKLMTELE